ncbi:MAG: acyl-CoA dehydrogenase family protein [Pseudomonadota bacterium]
MLKWQRVLAGQAVIRFTCRMTFALRPKTPAGEKLYAAACQIQPALLERAASADLHNEMPAASYQDLMDSGVAAAFVPAELGGFGLQSVHDWIVGIVTLAQGDPSAAIAINMHLGVSRGMALAYHQASNTPAKAAVATRLALPLEQIAQGNMLICATATEPGTDNLHPRTEATPCADGWQIHGHKIFVTMSPLATHLGMNLRMRDAEGDHLVTTMLPMDTPGLLPQGDWDALGMRGSGSQSVKFDGAVVPAGAVRKLGPWGEWSVGVLMNRALANLPLVGAFLGIAEAAHAMALEKLGSQTRVDAPVTGFSGVQNLVGEMDIELAKCRAILTAAADAVDRFVTAHASEPPSLEAAHQLMKDYQAAKWVVNRGAIDIVSKAMDLMGGSGYTNQHPLARMYRDVRAGPFMQPFAPTEAREYVGQVALGRLPTG